MAANSTLRQSRRKQVIRTVFRQLAGYANYLSNTDTYVGYQKIFEHADPDWEQQFNPSLYDYAKELFELHGEKEYWDAYAASAFVAEYPTNMYKNSSGNIVITTDKYIPFGMFVSRADHGILIDDIANYSDEQLTYDDVDGVWIFDFLYNVQALFRMTPDHIITWMDSAEPGYLLNGSQVRWFRVCCCS